MLPIEYLLIVQTESYDHVMRAIVQTELCDLLIYLQSSPLILYTYIVILQKYFEGVRHMYTEKI